MSLSIPKENGLISLKSSEEFYRTIPLEIDRINSTKASLEESKKNWSSALKASTIATPILFLLGVLFDSSLTIPLFGFNTFILSLSLYMKHFRERQIRHIEIKTLLTDSSILIPQLDSERPSFFEFAKRKAATSQGPLSLEEFTKLRRNFQPTLATNEATDACIPKLQNLPLQQHPEILRDWVVQVYKTHGINLSKDRGGHMRDVWALTKADEELNPVLLQKLEGLKAWSEEANRLLQKAKEEDKPLSELIFS